MLPWNTVRYGIRDEGEVARKIFNGERVRVAGRGEGRFEGMVECNL